MNITIKEVHEQVLSGLSTLVVFHLKQAAFQQYTPDSDPDKSDATIADSKEKAEKLRKIREEFEDIITGIIPF